MWNKVDCDIWKSATEGLKLPVFYNVDFLGVTAEAFKVNVDYYIFRKKGKILAVGAFYVKGSNIVTPETFTFTALWFSSELSGVPFTESALALIGLLKQNYSNISLKLDPLIKDIRPFSWSNFKIENKYTYIKKDEEQPHYSVVKNLSRLSENFYDFKVEQINDKSVKINLLFLKSLGFSAKTCNLYQYLLREWDTLGVLKAFNVYREEALICSNIVIVDKTDKKAYTILLNNVCTKEKYAHTFLYVSIIGWCQKNQILNIDLCGANLPSVATFKSYFNADLVGYFLLSYSPLKNKLCNLKKEIRYSLKKIKNKFG